MSIYENLRINQNIIRPRKPFINYNFIDGALFEVRNTPNENYHVSFIDKQNGQIIHSGEIGNNCWIVCSIKYWKDWLIKVERKFTGETYLFENNLQGKKVFICFESASLGDNLAWIPYVEEFRKKHNCHVICSTFWNHLFESEYPEIEFSPRGYPVPGIFACYRLGWFYNNGEVDYSRNPKNFRLRPMQQTASDILGLDFVEIKPKIKLNKNIEKEKIVSIALHGTCQAKYWNNESGWQKVVDYLKSKGYRVILISREEDGYMGNRHPIGIEKLPHGPIDGVIEVLLKSEFFIGIGSGLSWLSWAVGTPTVLISGFSYAYTEPSTDVIRIESTSGLCSGCFNEDKLDPSDWNWCPKFKGTDRQFECSSSITGEMVIQKLNHLINS
jgi:autotransporter strand-loop-strand O-heptosyltransferase